VIKRLSEDEKKELGIDSWPIWDIKKPIKKYYNFP